MTTTSTHTTTYSVEDLSCGRCVSILGRVIADVDGVHAVEVDHERGEVRVRTRPGASDAAVRAAMTDAGFEVW